MFFATSRRSETAVLSCASILAKRYKRVSCTAASGSRSSHISYGTVIALNYLLTLEDVRRFRVEKPKRRVPVTALIARPASVVR
jgi:hypothetical protein